MYSPFARGVAVAGVAATGVALSDRDRRDAVAGITNGSIRFVRAFGWGAAVSFDYKYRSVCTCTCSRHRMRYSTSRYYLQRQVLPRTHNVTVSRSPMIFLFRNTVHLKINV